MTYEEALDNVYGRLVFGIKPGLERITALMERLGNPQKKLKFVHVAGTNGKGTCATLVASALGACGLRVGLYTSPYVLEFRERFQIDGEMIPKEELVEEVETLAPIADQFEESGDQVTEFEYITALALHWFARRQCDIVVLEVGMGGRFDATNVIDVPEVAAIMSISLDHTAILGSTLEKIAFEKAGIVKAGGRLVLYPDQAPEVTQELEQICQERQVELFRPDLSQVEEGERSIGGTAFTVAGTRWGDVALRTPFLGEHQVKNAVTALKVLEVLAGRGWPVTPQAVAAGFEKAFIPARMEVISQQPLVLLDGGHNPGCSQALRQALEEFVPQRKVAIMGVMADKDSRGELQVLGPLFSQIVTVAPEGHRAMPAQQLAQIAQEFCPKVVPAGSCREALAVAARAMKQDAALIVCGSFYLAGEIREMLKGKFGN
ncbi:MAG: folylpolyglutamate synthase/dihydrofolate synthase family protein [Acutalibacter sp.]